MRQFLENMLPLIPLQLFELGWKGGVERSLGVGVQSWHLGIVFLVQQEGTWERGLSLQFHVQLALFIQLIFFGIGHAVGDVNVELVGLAHGRFLIALARFARVGGFAGSEGHIIVLE